MPRKDFPDTEKLAILEILAQTPKKSQEVVAAETHHGKVKISATLREFRSMPWERARAFCGGRERLLALRHDYVDEKVAEAKLEEGNRRANIVAIRHEVGLPLSPYIDKDGTVEI